MSMRNKVVVASIFYLMVMMLFSSCLSSRNIDEWVNKKYANSIKNVETNSGDTILISTSGKGNDIGDTTSLTKQKQSKVLPLLLFWKWHHAHTTNLNEKIPLGKFSQTFLYYANVSPLKTKLAGRKLELTINNLPRTFTVYDNGWMAVPLFYYFGAEEFYINPVKKKMVVGYRLYEGSKIKKSGVISIQNTDKMYEQFFFRATKSMTYEYLDQYEKNLVVMAKDFVDKLSEELFVYSPKSSTASN